MFNRIGLVEVKPSRYSYLNREVEKAWPADRIVRLADIREKRQTIDVIKTLFGERRA
jgi:hypothetical protein